ncbi:MAG: hypothetical protein ACMXX6_01845 [Candidatus Woesearchaeota archaeon]
MTSTINNRLENIENFLQRIENKLDNFLGMEQLSSKDRKELDEIKKEMDEGKVFTYEEVFN